MPTAPSSKEVIRRYRSVYLAVLLIPVFGIIIALVLVAFLGHPRLNLIFLILGLVTVQYLGLVAYIWRRMAS